MRPFADLLAATAARRASRVETIPALRCLLALTVWVALPASALPAPAPPEPLEAAELQGAASSSAPAARSASGELEALVAEALSRAPALAAKRAELEARSARESPAGALPDPMLESVLQNIGFEPTLGSEEMSMLGIQARQSLPYPGKRAAARDAARADTERSRAELLALERQIAAEVRTLYAQVWAIDREREALGAAQELIELLEEVAHTRYAAGEGDQEGVIKVQIRQLRLAERIGDLVQERQILSAGLNRWLDRAGDFLLGSTGALPAPQPIGAETQVRALAGSAEVHSAQAAVTAAERRVALARLELKPSYSATAGIASRGGYDPALQLGFGIELPLWRRQKQLPLLRAAELELEAARRERADVEARVRAEVTGLLAVWRNADEQANRYHQGILPQTSAALAAARSAYLTGRGSFSTVIEDFDLWLEARVALVRREADRFLAVVALDRIAGTASLPTDRKE